MVKKKRRRCRRWGGEDEVPAVVGGCFRRWAGVDGWDEQVVEEAQGHSLMRPLTNAGPRSQERPTWVLWGGGAQCRHECRWKRGLIIWWSVMGGGRRNRTVEASALQEKLPGISRVLGTQNLGLTKEKTTLKQASGTINTPDFPG